MILSLELWLLVWVGSPEDLGEDTSALKQRGFRPFNKADQRNVMAT